MKEEKKDFSWTGTEKPVAIKISRWSNNFALERVEAVRSEITLTADRHGLPLNKKNSLFLQVATKRIKTFTSSTQKYLRY